MTAININKNNFQNEVLNSDKPVLLDFWLVQCGVERGLQQVTATLFHHIYGSTVTGTHKCIKTARHATKSWNMCTMTLTLH